MDLAAVGGINWFGDEPWLLRPKREQAAPGLAPDWYPPITAARFGAMLDELWRQEPAADDVAAGAASPSTPARGAPG